MSPLLSSVASPVGIKRDKGESLHKTKTKTKAKTKTTVGIKRDKGEWLHATKTNTKTKTKTKAVWKFFMFCSSSATK